jgi:hypothetical protein
MTVSTSAAAAGVSTVVAGILTFAGVPLPLAAGILAAADDTSVPGIPDVAVVLPVVSGDFADVDDIPAALKCCYWCPIVVQFFTSGSANLS